jgi:PAS domain-containing protein
MSALKILHYEPNLLDAGVAAMTLKSAGIDAEIERAASPQDVLDELHEEMFTLALCEMANLHVVMAHIRTVQPSLPVIVLSKSEMQADVEKAIALSASDYVFKSQIAALPDAIRELLTQLHAAPVPTQSASPFANEHSDSPFAQQKNDSPLAAQPESVKISFENNLAENLRTLQSTLFAATPQFTSNPATPQPNSNPTTPSLAQATSPIERSVSSESAERQELESELKVHQSRVAMLERLIEELRTGLQERETEQASVEKSLRAEVASLRAEVASLQTKAASLQDALRATESRVAESKAVESQAAVSSTSAALDADLLAKLQAELEAAQQNEMDLRSALQDSQILARELQAKLADSEASIDQAVSQAETRFKVTELRLTNELLDAHELETSVRAELDNIQTRVMEMESGLRQAESERDALAAQRAAERERLAAELAAAQAAIVQLQTKNDQLAAELAAAPTVLEQHHEKALEELRAEKAAIELQLQSALRKAQSESAEKPKSDSLESRLFAAMDIAVMAVNLKGTITAWNQAAAAFHQIETADALGQKGDSMMNYKYASSKERKAVLTALQTSGKGSAKIIYQTKSGEEKAARLTLAKLFDESKSHIGFLSILEPLAVRDEKERSMFHALRPLLKSDEICFFTIDERGKITAVENPSIIKTLAPDFAVGKSGYELFAKSPLLIEAIGKILSGGSLRTSVMAGTRLITFQMASSHNDDGKITGASILAV